MTSDKAVELIKKGYTPRFVESQQAQASQCGCQLVEITGDVDGQTVHDLARRWGITRKVAHESRQHELG